jgi:ABC-type ATPase involved in cell division
VYALVNDPVILLADEATGNFDTRTSYEIKDIFQRLNEKSKTIVDTLFPDGENPLGKRYVSEKYR